MYLITEKPTPQQVVRWGVGLVALGLVWATAILVLLFAESTYASARFREIHSGSTEAQIDAVLWLFRKSEGGLADFPDEFLNAASLGGADTQKVLRYELLVSSFHAAMDGSDVMVFGYAD